MASRFALSVEPFSGESLPGYVLRLAGRAYLPTGDRVAAMSGLRQPGSAFASQSLGRLADMAGVDADRLRAMAYLPLPRVAHHRFLEGSLHREFIDVGRRRACPRCLERSAHHRYAWDFALATACPVHAVRLLAACPACGRGFGWREPDLLRCRCGALLTDCPGEPVSGSELASQTSVGALADGGVLPPMPDGLTGCDRADLVRVTMCLGMFLSGWKRQRRVETLVDAGPDMVAGVVASGLECLRDWPGRLHGFLQGEREHADRRPGRYGARKTLGPFYDWLNLMPPGPVKTTVAEACAAYVHSDAVLARRVHRSVLVSAPLPAPDRVLGSVEVGRRLGHRGAGVRRLLDAGLLTGEASEGRGIPAAFDSVSVDRLAAAVNDGLNLAETAKRLGISKDRLRRVVDGGLLAPLHRGTATGWGRWLFAVSEVEGFLQRLEDGHSEEAADSTVGFETAVEALRRRGMDLTGVLDEVLSGRLGVAGLDASATGLKRLRFRMEDVRGRCGRPEEARQLLTLQDVARRLGVKWQVASHLVRAGLLGTENGAVTVRTVAAFQSAFVSGAALAASKQTSPRHIAAVLNARGVRPVVGPAIDGSRQNFYLRSDAGS